VADVLAAADVFAFPSLWEGLGGALIEAMALGLPLVASDLDAIAEVVDPDGNALLVPPADPRALAEAIAALLDDPARAASFGARSRALFESRYTLDASTSRMIELFRRVAASRGAAADAAR
jgi:glycosyltransferase involved in cell wall biosynthesis